jgi:hypothetical protein
MIMEENKIYHPGKEEQHLEALKADLDEINSYIVTASQLLAKANDMAFDLRNKINSILNGTKRNMV